MTHFLSSVTNAADLGSRLRAERRALGLTQAELAKRVLLSRQTVIDAEAGKNVSVYVLMSLLSGLGKALNVTDAKPSFEDLQHMFTEEGEEDEQNKNTSGPYPARPSR